MPGTTGALARPRLFTRLDGLAAAGRAAWICGPAGQGKTTLAATWLAARHPRAAWLRVDPADGPAALLEALVRAAGSRVRRDSTRATRGDDLHLHAVLRRLLGGPLRGRALCIDDLPERPGPAHALARALLEEAPEGQVLVFASRAEPSPGLARFYAADRLVPIGAEDLRLGKTEALAVGRLRAPRVPAGEVERAWRETEGWAAGFVLSLARAAGDRRAPSVTAFLSGEILASVDPALRRHLCEAALLPVQSPCLLEAATGSTGAADALEAAARDGLFTERTGPWSYRFHPLFGRALLEHAREALPAGREAQIRLAAARALAAGTNGEAEQAASLLAGAEGWDDLEALVLRHAPARLAAGEGATILRWVALLPEGRRTANPWIALWSGIARVALDPTGAGEALERSMAGFLATAESEGLWLAWAGRVECAVARSGGSRALEQLLGERSALAARFPTPREDVSARVALAGLSAAATAWPDHAEVPAWTAAVRRMASGGGDPEARLGAGVRLLRIGEWTLPSATADEELFLALDALAAAPAARGEVTAAWLAGRANWLALRGNPDLARRFARRAVTLVSAPSPEIEGAARAAGILAALASVPGGAPGRARDPEGLAPPGNEPHPSPSRWLQALHALRVGRFTEAVARAAEALQAAEAAGDRLAAARAGLLLCMAHARCGEHEPAQAALAAVRQVAERTASRWLRGVTALAASDLLGAQGNAEAAATLLTEGFGCLREAGVNPVPWLDRGALARCCAAALAMDLEVPFVTGLVRSLHLAPPPEDTTEAWPWPVRIRAMGRFEVFVEGSPLVGASRRPVDVLRVLVACGGRDVPEHVVAEALWPEADGDAAHHALETALYRLRRLVGADVIVLRDGLLSIRRERCWVDALELEDRLASAIGAERRAACPDDAKRQARRIADLYRGPLLAQQVSEPWATDARERLRRRLSRWAARLDTRQADPHLLEDLRDRLSDGCEPGLTRRSA